MSTTAIGVDALEQDARAHGLSDRLRLPDRKFNRGIGQFCRPLRSATAAAHRRRVGRAGSHDGCRRRRQGVPAVDHERPIYEPGKFANYIAPPRAASRARRSTSNT
jgi:hypothetical protein